LRGYEKLSIKDPRRVDRVYAEKYAKVMDGFYGLKSSWNASNVVRAVEQAVLSRYPKAQYLVGLDAKYFFNPCGLLPTHIQEWLFSSLYLKDVDSYLKRFLLKKSTSSVVEEKLHTQ